MLRSGKKKANPGAWLLFWLAFVIVILLLFMLNAERIKDTLGQTKILERLSSGAKTEEDPSGELERHILELASAVPPEAAAEPAAQSIPQGGGTTSQTLPVPLDETAAVIAAQRNQQETKPAQQAQPDLKEKTVERSVYLMKVDTVGTILWTSVKRNLPASDSPLLDVLEALVKGPSATEEKQGLISLIPKSVKIQNAVVRGNTAYISFSEEFLFNTYGTEGYAGQRKQIILTATEFNNVKDVQILIEGKRIDYLGEGVWIGSPVSRSML